MESNFTKEQQYIKARKKVEEIKGFYIHLVVFAIVMPVIIYVNLRFVPQFHWFWFSLIGWGMGVFFHWFGVMGMDKLGLGKDWEDRKVREYMNKDTKNK